MGVFSRKTPRGAEANIVDESDKSDVMKADKEHIEEVESQPPIIETVDPAVARRVVRKFDLHLIPWLFIFWLLAFVDRSNIGNAKIAGLQAEATNPKTTQFNIALAIFYVPYICVDVPSNWVLVYFRAGRYLPFLITSWGLCSTFTGFVTNYGGLLAARFFLGLCEGGLLGGMILYLSMFYRRHQLLYRIGLFYCAAPLAGAFGGLLAAGLGKISTPGYVHWPFIFFVEGAITVVVGLISFFFLPHTPAEAKFLTPSERAAAKALMETDAAALHAGPVSKSGIEPDKFHIHWVKLALLNINTQLLSLNFFAIITPIYSYSLFLPTIIKALGYSTIVSQLFSVPPNICGFIAVLVVAHLSDKYRMRGPFMMGGALLAIGGYIMLISSAHPLVEYGGTFLVASGIFPCSPLVMGWLSNNLHPHYVRATGTGYQIMIANLAAFIAVFVYLSADAPRFFTGHAINIGMLVLSFCLSGFLVLYQKGENRKRSKGARNGRVAEINALHGEGSENLLGNRHPGFRYTI